MHALHPRRGKTNSRKLALNLAVLATALLVPLTGCMDALHGSDVEEWDPGFPSHLEVRIRGAAFDAGDTVSAKLALVNDDDERKVRSPDNQEYQLYLYGPSSLIWTEAGESYNPGTTLIPHGQVTFGEVAFELYDLDGEPLPPGYYSLKVKWYGLWGEGGFTVRDPNAETSVE